MFCVVNVTGLVDFESVLLIFFDSDSLLQYVADPLLIKVKSFKIVTIDFNVRDLDFINTSCRYLTEFEVNILEVWRLWQWNVVSLSLLEGCK